MEVRPVCQFGSTTTLIHSSSLLCTKGLLSPSPQYTSSSGKCMSICHHHHHHHWMPLPLTRQRGPPNAAVSLATSRNATSSQEQELSCKVLWTIEADLADGQLLYITGDPIALGCWNLDLAILMFPTEHVNLWKTHVKVPRGINFKYSYFIRGDKCASSNVIWRPGPEYSVSIPFSKKKRQKVLVRDTWMTTVQTERFPLNIWGSWMDLDNMSLPYSDECASFKSVENEYLLSSKRFAVDASFNELPYVDGNNDALSVSSSKGFVFREISVERDQPIEEPWLHQSSLFFPNLKDNLDTMVFNNDSDQDGLIYKEFPDSSYHVKEDPDDESRSARSEDPISTLILINSSLCTVQRIAILENEKLVELLLEPVKNNVQCDSVYLGVITKLVPNMGGAFVNIGIARPSLMDIKQKREPFAFPPFRRRAKGKEITGSAAIESEDQSDISDNQLASLDDVDSDDDEVILKGDSEHFMNGDLEDHEVDDDFDVPQRNLNGSVVDYGRGVTDYENHTYQIENHLDSDEVDGFLPTETEDSDDFHLSHSSFQDMKDSVKAHSAENKWDYVRKGTKVIVQVVKEGLGTKGPTLTAYPNLRSRFWILITRCDRIGVSKKIAGVERTRLKVIARTLQPPGFGLTVRTVAAGHSLEELQKDLEGLLSTWKSIEEHAKSAALAADEGVEGAVPVILHRAMGQTLSVAQDYFNEKVEGMVVDSPRTYHEITSYLQEIAPDLCNRVELYAKKIPIFDEYGIEEEINNMLSKRVPLANGGSLVIEQTEALVSIDVNGGHGMLGGQGNSQEKAILEVNLAAAKQIARELRLRDIGGIIVVDFIDMVDDSNKRLVYEEVKKAVERDRSTVRVSELSRHGLMEITRKRVRPSVTFMISEPCTCCHATGRVEALETSFSKIEHEICRLQAMSEQKADPGNPKSWPKFVLKADRYMCNYLTSGKRTRLALLSSSLKVWILLKVARGFSRGSFEVKPFLDDKENKYHNQVALSRLKPTEGRIYIPSTKLSLFPIKKWKTGRK